MFLLLVCLNCSTIPVVGGFDPIAVKKAVTKKAVTKTAAKKAPAKRVAAKEPGAVKASKKTVVTEPEEETTTEAEPAWVEVVKAIQDKKGMNTRVLDLRDVTSFTDYFIITQGTNFRQNMAIVDGVEGHLKKEVGDRPSSIEGYTGGDWILMDYGDYIVHVFSAEKRAYYDLERLYRNAKTIEIPDEPLSS